MSASIPELVADLRRPPPSVDHLAPVDFLDHLSGAGWRLVVINDRRSIWEHPQAAEMGHPNSARVFIPGYKSVDFDGLARLALDRIANMPETRQPSRDDSPGHDE